MPKFVYYEHGPDRITAGIAGQLKKGVPRELPDKVADLLLKKKMFKEGKNPKKK